MTLLDCVDAIAAYLPEVVADLQLETPRGKGRRAPQVVSGWLPPKDPKDPDREEDYPVVVVRFVGHDDASGESAARIEFRIGTYSESADGWRDVVNVIERIRQAFLKKRTVDKKFRLELPVKSHVPTEDQTLPYWVGFMETRWTIAQPVEEVIIDGENWA